MEISSVGSTSTARPNHSRLPAVGFVSAMRATAPAS
jgi:hypothetical protein